MLRAGQTKLRRNNDSLKEHAFIPTGSTVTNQREDDRPWTHGTITEHGDTKCIIYYHMNTMIYWVETDVF